MDIFSWKYLFFVAIVLVLYWAVMPKKARCYLLLAASLVVLFFQKPSFIIITFVYFYITWYLGNLIFAIENKALRRIFLVVGIVFSVTLLGYYKYGGYFHDVHLLSLSAVVAKTKAQEIASAMTPLGISYFTFRVIHYIVEVFRGTFPRARLADFLLYITFFPTVIAGPIDRYDNFEPQRDAAPDFKADDLYVGMSRIVQGLFKKLVISATLFQFLAPYYKAVGPLGDVHLTTGQIWLLHNVYILYLYTDFSGYSDIAIGTARLFGYRIMENFHWPILQPNIAKFWANWHISLTRWLQTYIYFALGGSRRGLARSVLYTFITMGVLGAWHGSGQGFIHYALFGIYHGVIVVIYRFWRKFKEKKLPNLKPSKLGYALGVLLTFEAFNTSWPIFVFPTWKALIVYMKMFGIEYSGSIAKLKVVATGIEAAIIGTLVLFVLIEISIRIFNRNDKQGAKA